MNGYAVKKWGEDVKGGCAVKRGRCVIDRGRCAMDRGSEERD